MNYIKRSVLQNAARSRNITEANAKDELKKSSLFGPDRKFDIFLSHRKLDQKEVVALADIIRGYGYSVYIDWETDPHLDRSKVNIETAKKLKSRMKQCRSLVFVTTENFSTSKWMPWELGFMDGRTSRALILPVVDDTSGNNNFVGQEYLGIYPHLIFLTGLFIELEPKKYTNFSTWLNEPEKVTALGSIYG